MKALDDLLGIWPSHADFARDINLDPRRVSMMVQRQSIPARHWSAIIAAAERRAKEAYKAGDHRLSTRFESVTAESLLALNDALDR